MNSWKQVDALIAGWKAEGISIAEIIRRTAEAMMGWPYVWGAVGAECTVAKRQYYMGRSGIGPGDVELVRKRCQILNGSSQSCAGCKYYPDGERTRINDCQGFVKQVCKAAGITLTGGGCTSMWKNDSICASKGEIRDMPDVVCCVFKYISSTGKMDHIGIHVGGGQIIHCSVEVKTGKITDRGWTHYAVPKQCYGSAVDSGQFFVVSGLKPTIRKGSVGAYVAECQERLMKLGYDLGRYGADGKFGDVTVKAVLAFQRDHQLKVDGIVGPDTWAKLCQPPVADALTALSSGESSELPDGESLELSLRTKLYTVTIPHLTEAKADELLQTFANATKTEERSE